MDEQIKFKIGKMLGMLGSEYDGEIVAAARQIGRLLASQKMTFADLVQAFNGSQKTSKNVRASPQDQVMAMVDAILENEMLMRDHELRFVKDFEARLYAGYKFTDKQIKWFHFLYAKYAER